jgi:hypothetical protein
MPYFSRNLIKAVNAWQAGSVGKAKKASRLRDAVNTANLNDYYRSCDEPCYRRSTLVGKAVKELLFEFYISEETSAWSTRQNIVASFRDGPPNPPVPGVIFKHAPKAGEVVLNLVRLYEHPEFWKSVDHWDAQGLNLSKGIKRYHNSQYEVVMNVDQVLHDEIFAFGGNSAIEFAKGEVEGVSFIGGADLDPENVKTSLAEAGVPVKRWVFGESVPRIYMNFIRRSLKRLDAKFSRQVS